jgi:micrococcal nuclease
MKNFLKENRIFWAILVGALVIGGAIYFSQKESRPASSPTLPPPPAQCLAPEKTIATKIIDGDTIVIEGGYSVRILGIDADEMGYPCYDEAKSRLEELILNKEVKLEKDITDLDQYKRCLRYVFLPASAEASAGKDDKNIGLELVKEGLAIARFYEPDLKYKEEISLAEKTAIENKIGCKWSAFAKASADKSSEEKIEFSWEKLTPEITGLKMVGACNAGNYYGKEMVVEGKIVATYRSKTNTVFLNFEKPYPNHCFTGVIFSSDQYKFVQNPENYYLNKTVRIKGQIKEYQGKPEIILKIPDQIEIGK